jgi:hypothetical protein
LSSFTPHGESAVKKGRHADGGGRGGEQNGQVVVGLREFAQLAGISTNLVG